jgi:anti-sigma regulatory factor (Ser/Thr protein kinase)
MTSQSSDRTRTFPSESASAKLARDFVRSLLRTPPPVPTEVVSSVELAVSELATNGVRHGSGDPVTVDLGRDPDVVTMCVTSTLPSDGDSDPTGWERTDRTGHGIGIVRAISTGLTFRVSGTSVSASCRFPIAP